MLILLGLPGSGKGTISNELVKDGFIHISIGDLFRNLGKENNELSKKVKRIIDSGNFIDDNTTYDVIMDTITKYKDTSKLILDGYPRNLKQVQDLNKYLESTKSSIKIIFLDKNIKQSDSEYIEFITNRLLDRGVCQSCGSSYNRHKNSECQKCGGKLLPRQDDTYEKIQTRLKLYNQHTKPVIEFYNKNNYNIIIVDTTQDITEAVKTILK